MALCLQLRLGASVAGRRLVREMLAAALAPVRLAQLGLLGEPIGVAEVAARPPSLSYD
jgi:hypothetical protein